MIDRLVSRIENYEFPTALRIAVGAACYPTHAVDAESLKRQAMSRPIVNWRGGVRARPPIRTEEHHHDEVSIRHRFAARHRSHGGLRLRRGRCGRRPRQRADKVAGELSEYRLGAGDKLRDRGLQGRPAVAVGADPARRQITLPLSATRGDVHTPIELRDRSRRS